MLLALAGGIAAYIKREDVCCVCVYVCVYMDVYMLTAQVSMC